MLAGEISRSLRNLARAPRFCTSVIATLALALGGAGGLLSLLDAVVLRTLPVQDARRLVAIFPANGEALFGISMPTLAAFAASQDVLDSVCGAAQGGALNVEANGATLLRASESVTGECSRVLGLDAAIGRLITTDDAPVEGPSASVVVLGHRFWQDTFGAAVDVIGRTLRVEGQPLTIIGVLPETYRGLNADEAPDIVVPLETMWRLRGGRVLALHMIGRLRDGVTLDQASAQFGTVWPVVWRATNPQAAPGAASRAGLAEHLRVDDLAHGFSTLRYRYAQPLRAVVILSGLLVLLACVNVGALCLARTVAREQQLAVQMTLGASRGRIAAGVCLECLTLALAAAAVAAPVAWWTSRGIALTIWTGPRPLSMDVTPSAATLVVLATLAFAAGLVASLPPVLAVWLREWRLSASHVRGVFGATVRWSHGMIAAQVALSLVLLFCAALLVNNLFDLRSRDLGYDAERLRWTRLDPVFGAPRGYDYPAYIRSLLERVAALPQVEHAALSSAFPTTEVRHMTALFPIMRHGDPEGALEARGSMDRVSPGFFRTAGIPLLAGREFEWHDHATAPAVGVLTQPLAARLFPSGDAVGSRIRIPGRKTDTILVIGIAGDFSPGDPRISGIPRVYVPLMQEPGASGLTPAVIMRAADDLGLLDGLQRAVQPLGRHHVSNVRTIREQTDRLLTQERAIAGLASAFAAFGVLVGAIGLYAVLAHGVARRVREIGLRMALGASRRAVLTLIVRDGMRMVLAGLVVGLPLALASGRAARILLFELSPYDLRALAAAVFLLVVAGAAAAFIPALRAAQTEPVEALRSE